MYMWGEGAGLLGKCKTSIAPSLVFRDLTPIFLAFICWQFTSQATYF